LSKIIIEPAAPNELAVTLEDKYQEISDFPNKKSKAVKIAPHNTSRKRVLASGRKAKTQANKVAIIKNDTPVLIRLIICRLMFGIYSLKKSPTLPINRPITLLRIRETIRRNPKPKIIEKERRRSIMIFNQPFLGLTLICQISLMEFCISTNIVVEEKTRTPIPM